MTRVPQGEGPGTGVVRQGGAPLWGFAAYGACGGLLSTALATLVGQVVYGSWDPTSHLVPIILLAALVLTGVGVARPVVARAAELLVGGTGR